MQNDELTLVLDEKMGLLGEWEKTCGPENIRVLLSRWEYMGGILLLDDLPTIPRNVSRQLRSLGFSDTIDKLLIRIAMAALDHTIVSDDSDFWDPTDRNSTGDPNAPVAVICQQQLGLELLVMPHLLQRLQSQ